MESTLNPHAPPPSMEKPNFFLTLSEEKTLATCGLWTPNMMGYSLSWLFVWLVVENCLMGHKNHPEPFSNMIYSQTHNQVSTTRQTTLGHLFLYSAPPSALECNKWPSHQQEKQTGGSVLVIWKLRKPGVQPSLKIWRLMDILNFALHCQLKPIVRTWWDDSQKYGWWGRGRHDQIVGK